MILLVFLFSRVAMMEVNPKKKFTGKGPKTSQEKNRFYKNNGKIALPKYAFHVTCLAVNN